MKKDDEIALKNEENDDDARAVKESELLPIFEAMSFSGDIQPLEDINTPEPVKAEYSQKKTNETRGTEKSGKNPHKNLPQLFRNKKTGRIMAAIVAAIVIIGVAAAGILINEGRNRRFSTFDTVYSAGKETTVRLEDKRTFTFSDAKDIKVSKDGKMLYYSKASASGKGKYDIRLMDVSKKKTLKKGGINICFGADDGWTVNTDGTFLCYSCEEAGVKNYFMYSAQKNETEKMASDVDEVFLPSAGDIVYYTHKVNADCSLFRMKFGEEPKKVVSNISHIKFFDSEKGDEVLYTVSSETGNNVDVYSVKDEEEPKRICSDAGEAYLDNYVYGGNLYYFSKKNTSSADLSWLDFVYDKYYQSDYSMKEPAEKDYMVEYGFLVKRQIFNEAAFQRAKTAYSDKQRRDSIRDALSDINLEFAIESEYECSVYNTHSSQNLVQGVLLKNVLAFSKEGTPAVICRKASLSADRKITMDTLVKQSKIGGINAAVDYVRKNLSDTYKPSKDCIYSWFDGNNVIQFTFNGYKMKDTKFFIASRTLVYVVDGGNLYSHRITKSEFGSSRLVSENVSECEVEGNFIYYKKTLNDGTAAYMRYSPDTGEQLLGNDISSFVVLDENNILLLTAERSDRENVRIDLSDGKSSRMIDTGVEMRHMVFSGKTVSYLKKSAETDKTGDVYVYTVGGSPEKISSGANSIVYVKERIPETAAAKTAQG